MSCIFLLFILTYALNTDGFGDVNNGDIGIQVFGNDLYAGTENEETGGEIWRTKGVGGPPFTDWEQVNTDGFGDINNEGISNKAVFNSHLYAGTENVAAGGGIWRSSDGTTWEQANTDGFGDVNNEKAVSLVVFGDYLYVGTDNDTGGEIWRTNGDTNNGDGGGGDTDGGNEDDDNGCFIETMDF